MARPALAATRAVSIINLLAAHPDDSFSLSDICRRLAINVASAHAILAALTQSGYLARHPRHHTYMLGPSLVAVGSAALEQHPAIDEARREARRLSDELALDVAITAVAGDEVVFVARSGAHQPRGLPIYVGQRMPLRPPLGSVYFAWASPTEVETWIARQPAAPPDAVAIFQADLAAVRRDGFAVALESGWRRDLGAALEHLAERPTEADARSKVAALLGQLSDNPYHLIEVDPAAVYGVSSIAAPVFGAAGEVALAVNLVGLPEKLTGDEVLALAGTARDAGVVVTKRTRGQLPDRYAS